MQETFSADQLKNSGVGYRSQANIKVVALRARSAGAVRDSRNTGTEHLCSSELGRGKGNRLVAGGIPA